MKKVKSPTSVPIEKLLKQQFIVVTIMAYVLFACITFFNFSLLQNIAPFWYGSFFFAILLPIISYLLGRYFIVQGMNSRLDRIFWACLMALCGWILLFLKDYLAPVLLSAVNAGNMTNLAYEMWTMISSSIVIVGYFGLLYLLKRRFVH